MDKIITKCLFCLAFFTLFALKDVDAQTLTIQNFTNGTYTPGSTIAVPFNIGPGSCIQQNNVFQLYLADAAGNILPGPPVSTYNGFYATFLNAVIPAGTAPGTYTFVVKSTNPAITSAPSPTFTVAAGAAVTAAITGPSIGPNYPDVFGVCNGAPNNTFSFFDGSSTGSSTANFFNESTQSSDGTVTLANSGNFTAAATNYTIIVQTTNGTTISTQAYTFLNNVINNAFAVSNTSTVCLAPAGGTLCFNVTTTTANGIQNNYPGTLYNITWGDGASNNYTFCDISALAGTVCHTYTTGSCGNIVNGQNNVFLVNIQPQSPFCVNMVSPLTTYAKVINVPTNSFTFPPTGCAGGTITFTNTSDPGQDPNATVNNCINPNARYTWYVDGVPKGLNYTLAQTFTYTFNTHGTHKITLQLNNGGTGVCMAANVDQYICIQNPPVPNFTLPPSPFCLNNPVIPTDLSVTDTTCASVNAYTWTVTGPGPVSYVGGTSANSQQPQFVFSQAGIYQITLSIGSLSCAATSAPQTIVVDAPPSITMSPDASTCGTNLTYTFDPNPGITQTTVTGTAQPQANTYTWAVTGNPNYSFAGGSTANSQYPQITFTGFGTYTVSVTEQNSCGTLTKSQNLTFQNVPAVTIDPVATICAGSTVNLTGHVVPATYTSLQWSGGTGAFTGSTTLTPTYTPSAAEITAGGVTLTLDVKTGLAGACSDLIKTITINISPIDNITSPPAESICTGSPVNYNITATVPGSTFNWTAANTTGTATGFTAAGTGSPINDVIIDTDPVNIAVITYTITAKDPNGCTGPPFMLKVTVNPKSVITAVPVNTVICSNSPGTINLTPNIPGTTYTWTSTVTGGITGNSQQPTPTATTQINDILNNGGLIAGTVTYVITPYNGVCPGAPVNVTITVQPLPVMANPGPNDIKCNITTYTFNANTPPAGGGLWTLTSGQTGVTFDDNTKPNATASGLVPGNIYTFAWTITIPGCQSSSKNITIQDDAPSNGGATSSNATVCSGNNGATITLAGQVGNILRWESSIDNGATWQPIANVTTTLQYVNLTQSTLYRAAVQNGICTFAYSTVTAIVVNPAAALANAGTNQEVCNVTSYTLNGNNPAPVTGLWTVTSGQAGITFSDPTQYNATVSGLVPGDTYQFTWTITPSAPCAPNSSSVTITDDAPTVGGTTGNNATVCAGNNGGTITLTGQLGNVLRWESSIDNGATWQPIANVTATLQYVNLAQTTQHRAVVQNGVCTFAYSTVTVIVVNPPAVLANAGTNQELCNVTSYTLNGNNPSPATGLWTVTSGQAGVTFSDPTQYNATVSGLIPGDTYQFTWTITPGAGCAPNASSVIITDDAPSVGGTTAGGNAFCAGGNVSGNITLTGQLGTILRWESSIDNGATWQTIINTTTTQQYLNLTQTTQYRAVVQNGVCTFAYSTVSTIVINQPAIQANAGTNQEICNATTYTLNGNSATPNAGLWTVTSGQTGITFSDPTQANAIVSGLIPGNTYQFTWTITPGAPCTPNFSSVIITDDLPTIGGTTSSDATVCATGNGATITLTGQTGVVLRWETSADNGTTWLPIVNTATTQQYLNLIQTTQYRAVVQNGVCAFAYSTVTTIVVNQPVVQANGGGNQQLCGATSFTLQGNNPAPFTGTWTQTAGPAVTIVSPNNSQTQVTGVIPGNNYSFLWTIKALAPCPDSSDPVQIIDLDDVIASFTPDKTNGCGPVSVNFTNTSSSLTGVSFQWNFGDGSAISTAVSPSHTFAPRTDGKDTTYTVSLSIINNCVQRPPSTVDITVSPNTPIAYIVPQQVIGCSPFTIAVDNFSPGNNKSYTYYLYDGAVLVQQIVTTNKNQVTFNPVTTNATKTYTVYMVATGFCGNTGQSQIIPITVQVTNVIAQMFIANGVTTGCVPYTADFVNNSTGGDKYYYTIYDANHVAVDQQPGGTLPLPYTFNSPGTYYVTITAANSCTTIESPPIRMDVYPLPTPQFTADVTSGCRDLLVTFTNQTPDAPNAQAKSLSYDWNFGDGSADAHTFAPPPHLFNSKNSPFTVTLTATSLVTGCSNVVTKVAYINVIAPPGTQFTEKPDSVTSIPNYHFNFIDQTTGSPVSWTWSFGDGKGSTSQNPGHTYLDTGFYKVTLTTATAAGCDSTIAHIVRITGVPGQLFLPNAFEPGSGTDELRTFMAKGSGIKEWHMQIFNNFAQVVWETTRLDEKGAPVDGWDGTFKGQPAPQGVYIWQVSAKFINGTDWKGNVIENSLPKRIGVIHLIR